MKRDYLEKLAKLMGIEADGLRATRLPQENIRRVFLRARRAKWTLRIAGSLIGLTMAGSAFLPEQPTTLSKKLDGAMAFTFFGAICVCAGKKRAAQITSEVTVAMGRRIAEMEKERAH
jgi:hypothetical protein